MTTDFEIDFVQMPWSRTAAGWRYVREDVWDALQQAVSPGGHNIRVRSEASANCNLSGTLEVSSAGFRAVVTIAREEGDPLVVPDHSVEGAQRYFEEGEVEIAASNKVITASVVVRFSREEKGRMEFLLRSLWDLQLYALRILQDAGADAVPGSVPGHRQAEAGSVQ